MVLQSDNFILDIERWIKAYKSNIVALSYSNNTISLYNRAIDQFYEYVLSNRDDMELRKINSIYITNFLAYLEDEARVRGKKVVNGSYLSKSTKNTYLKAVKSLFSFISDNNDDLYTFDRFFKKIKIADSSQLEDKLVYLSEDEIDRLLDVIEKYKNEKGRYKDFRNALLVKLLLNSGLRISEALNLSLSDFKDSEYDNVYSIDIYAKGGKKQIAYILKDNIDDELAYFRDDIKIDEDSKIMVSGVTNIKQWNRSSAFVVVNNLYKEVGIKKRGLHLLRHTLAMRLTKRDVNPIIIKKILRHSNIATTTIYAKATVGSVVGVLV